MMRWRCGAVTYLILRDIFPDWAFEAGILRKGPAYFGFKAFEWLQYKAADIIGVQSKSNKRYFDDWSLRAHIEVLNNWRDLEAPAVLSPEALGEYGLAGKRVLVFGGTLGVAQDLGNLLRLAKRVRVRSDIAIFIVGNGPEKQYLINEVAAQGLTNVKIGEGLSEAAFERLLTICHGGLISLDRKLTSHNVPGKLLSYLKSGLPVLASVNPGNDLIELVNHAEVGIAVVNGDDDGFAAAALRLCDELATRSTWSKNARALADREFSAKAAAAQVIEATAPFIRKLF
jgi:glycosyltransferase involved in cell wall biosynthesis